MERTPCHVSGAGESFTGIGEGCLKTCIEVNSLINTDPRTVDASTKAHSVEDELVSASQVQNQTRD